MIPVILDQFYKLYFYSLLEHYIFLLSLFFELLFFTFFFIFSFNVESHRFFYLSIYLSVQTINFKGFQFNDASAFSHDQYNYCFYREAIDERKYFLWSMLLFVFLFFFFFFATWLIS